MDPGFKAPSTHKENQQPPTTPSLHQSKRSINIILGENKLGKPTPHELTDSRKQLSSHKAQVIANQVGQLKLPSHRVKLNNSTKDGGIRRSSFIPEYEDGNDRHSDQRSESQTFGPNLSFVLHSPHNNNDNSSQHTIDSSNRLNQSALASTPTAEANTPSKRSSFLFDITSPTRPQLRAPSTTGGLNSSFLTAEKSNVSQYTSMIRSTSLVKSTSRLPNNLDLSQINSESNHTSPFDAPSLITPTNFNYNFHEMEHFSQSPQSYAGSGCSVAPSGAFFAPNNNAAGQFQPIAGSVYRNPNTSLPLEETSFATPVTQLLGEIDLPLYYLAPTQDIFPATRAKLAFYNESHSITQHSISLKNQRLLASSSGVPSNAPWVAGLTATNGSFLCPQQPLPSLTPAMQQRMLLESELSQMNSEIEAIDFMLSQVKRENNGKLPKQYRDNQKAMEKLVEEMKKHEKKRQREIKKLFEQEEKDRRKNNGLRNESKLPALSVLTSLSFMAQTPAQSTTASMSIFASTPAGNSSFAVPHAAISSTTAPSTTTATTGRKTSLFRFSKIHPSSPDKKQSKSITPSSKLAIASSTRAGAPVPSSTRSKRSKIGSLLGFSDPNREDVISTPLRGNRLKYTTTQMPSVFSPRTTTATQTVTQTVNLDLILSHPLTLHYFYLMLEKECSLENLAFWKDVALLYSLFTDLCSLRESELQTNQQSLSVTLFYLTQYFYYAAALMFEEYVCHDAPSQINLPDRVSLQLEKTICELGEANQVINRKIELHGYRLAAEIEEAEQEKERQTQLHHSQRPSGLISCVEEEDGNLGDDDERMANGDGDSSSDSILHLRDLLPDQNMGSSGPSFGHMSANTNMNTSSHNLLDSPFLSISPQNQKAILDGEMQTAFILSVIDLNFDQEQGQYLEIIMEAYLSAASEIQALLSRDTMMRFKKDPIFTHLVSDCLTNDLYSLFFQTQKPVPALARTLVNTVFQDRVKGLQTNNLIKALASPHGVANVANRVSQMLASPRGTPRMMSPRKTQNLIPITPKLLKPSTQQQLQQQQQHHQQRTVKIYRKPRGETPSVTGSTSMPRELGQLTPQSVSQDDFGDISPFDLDLPAADLVLSSSLSQVKPHLRVDTIRAGGSGISASSLNDAQSQFEIVIGPISPIVTSSTSEPTTLPASRHNDKQQTAPLAPLSPFTSPRVRSFKSHFVPPSPGAANKTTAQNQPSSLLPSSLFAPMTPRLLSPGYRKEHHPLQLSPAPSQGPNTNAASNNSFVATPSRKTPTQTRSRSGFSTRKATRYSFGRNSPVLQKPPQHHAPLQPPHALPEELSQPEIAIDNFDGPSMTPNKLITTNHLNESVAGEPNMTTLSFADLDDFLPKLPVPTISMMVLESKQPCNGTFHDNEAEPHQNPRSHFNTKSATTPRSPPKSSGANLRRLQVQARQNLFSPNFVLPSPQTIPPPPTSCRVRPFYSPSVTIIRRQDECDIDFDIIDHNATQMSRRDTHNNTITNNPEDVNNTTHIRHESNDDRELLIAEQFTDFSPTVVRKNSQFRDMDNKNGDIDATTFIQSASVQRMNSFEGANALTPSQQQLNLDMENISFAEQVSPQTSPSGDSAVAENERVGQVYNNMKLRMQRNRVAAGFKVPGTLQSTQLRTAIQQARRSDPQPDHLVSMFPRDDDMNISSLRDVNASTQQIPPPNANTHLNANLMNESFIAAHNTNKNTTLPLLISSPSTGPPPIPTHFTSPETLVRSPPPIPHHIKTKSSSGGFTPLLRPPQPSPSPNLASNIQHIPTISTLTTSDASRAADNGLKSPLISRFALFKTRMKTSQATNATAAGQDQIDSKYSNHSIKAKWFGE